MPEAKHLGLFLICCLLALIGPAPAEAQAACGSQQFTYTFTNLCSFPIWIAQSAAASNGSSYPPAFLPCTSNSQCGAGQTCDSATQQCTCSTDTDCPGAASCVDKRCSGSWSIGPTCTADSQCGSGQKCSIAAGSKAGSCTCSTSADCPGSAACVGGSCSTSATFCMPQTWESGTFWPRTGCTSPAVGQLNCDTGNCIPEGETNGLLDCGVGITSPLNPVTQFEVTSSPDANYDVSLVAGSNVEMEATPVGGFYAVPGEPSPGNEVPCYAAGCVAAVDCPTNLVAPNGGCLDPCTQCQRSAPGGSDPNKTIYAALKCTSTLSGTAKTTDCKGNSGPTPTYQDMYCAQNMSDSTPQASSNQGTPTAFGQDDCFPGTTFVQPTYQTASYKPPSGVGVCLYTEPPQSGIAHFNDYGWYDAASGKTKNCGGLPPDYKPLADGTPCGGYLTQTGATYADALGYTCQTVTYQDSQQQKQTAHLCLPPTTSGLGKCVADSAGNAPLYTAVGGLWNQAWLTAGLQAGGGTTPYYETFKAACPTAYTWQYDDAASGFGCQAAAPPGGQPLSGFDVTFCLTLD